MSIVIKTWYVDLIVALQMHLKYDELETKRFNVFFYKWAKRGLFFVFLKQTIQFLQQINVKNVMSIQYPAPGFEPTTFGT